MIALLTNIVCNDVEIKRELFGMMLENMNGVAF